MSFAIIPVSLDSKLFSKTHTESVVSTLCMKLAEAYNLDPADLRYKFDEIVSLVLEGDIIKPVTKTTRRKVATESDSDAPTEKVKCKGVTKKGDPCKKYAINGTDFCSSHDKSSDEKEVSDVAETREKIRCKGVTRKGDPCKKLCTPQEEFCAQHKDTNKEDPTPAPVVRKTQAKVIDLDEEEKVPFSNEDYWLPMKVMTLAGKRHKLHERTGFLFKEEDGEFIMIGRKKSDGVYFVNPTEDQNALSQEEIDWAMECEILVD
jgi:hypothetical protein